MCKKKFLVSQCVFSKIFAQSHKLINIHKIHKYLFIIEVE